MVRSFIIDMLETLKDMENSITSIVGITLFSFGSLVVFLDAKLTIVIWWKPLQIAKHFQSQGITWLPCKLLLGNSLEFTIFMHEATTNPI